MLREGVQVLAQALMEAEVTELVGAGRYERTDERTAHRNGCRDLPECARTAASGRGDLDGTGRRMGGRGSALLQRRVDAPAHAPVSADYGPGALDCNRLDEKERRTRKRRARISTT